MEDGVDEFSPLAGAQAGLDEDTCDRIESGLGAAIRFGGQANLAPEDAAEIAAV